MTINWTFTLVIVFYCMVMGCLGYIASRALIKQHDLREYFAMGGTAGAILVGFGYFTAAYSVSTWTGNLGYTYMIGLPFQITTLTLVPWGMVPYLLAGARLNIIGRRHGFSTLADYLGGRYYSTAIRVIAGFFCVVLLMPYIAAQIQASGLMFQIFGGWPYWMGCAIMAGIVLYYCSTGGMRGAVLTDIIQGALMIFLSIMVPVVAALRFGGLSGIFQRVAEIRPAGLYPPGSPTAWANWVVLTGWAVVGVISCGAPYSTQKFLCARDENSVRRASLITLIGGLTANVMYTALMGLVVIFMYPNIEGLKVDQLGLYVIRDLLSPFWATIAVAAVVAAGMSTIDSMVIMVSAGIIKDIYHALKPNVPEDTLLRYSKFLTAIIAAVAFLIALRPLSLIFTIVFFSINSLAMFSIPVLLGLWWKRGTKEGAIASIIAGELTLFAFSPFGWLASVRGMVASELVPGLIVTSFVYFAVSLLTPPPPSRILSEYFLGD